MDNKGIALFTIEVEDYAQLQDIIRAIKKVRNVLMVERLSGRLKGFLHGLFNKAGI